MTDQEIIYTILNGKTVREVYNAWSNLHENKEQLLRVHPLISECLVNVFTGKDPRFSKDQLEKSLADMRKEHEEQLRGKND